MRSSSTAAVSPFPADAEPACTDRAERLAVPNFLVIGAPRAGTTWIEKNLRAHPDVFMPARKELHFFDRHYERGIAYYESCFAARAGESAVGEATPDYLHGQYSQNDIPALIHRHLPDVRLIVSLRNPVDRAYSRFLNGLAKRDYNARFSFEGKLLARPEFIREGFYYDHLRRYLALFPRENLLVLLYDDMVADPRAFMRSIYEFLGVDADFESGAEGFTVNAAAGKRNLARSKALWYVSWALGRAGLYRLSERVRKLNSVRVPPMSRETRAKLIALYQEKNLQLQDLIGRDLRHWNRAPE